MGSGKGKSRRVRAKNNISEQERALVLQILERPGVSFSAKEIQEIIQKNGTYDLLFRRGASPDTTFSELLNATLEELQYQGLIALKEFPVFKPDTSPGSLSESKWVFANKIPEGKKVNLDKEENLVF